MLPESVAALVLQPVGGEEGHVLQPLQPHPAPPLTDDGGIWRTRGVGHDRGGPGEAVVQEAAAAIVDVVGIAVVGRAQRYHRLQRRRAERRALQNRLSVAEGNSVSVRVRSGGCWNIQ